MRCSELTHLKTGSLPLWPAFSHSPPPCSLWQPPFCLFPRAKQGSFSSETKPRKGGMAECSWFWGSQWESTAKPRSGKAPPAPPPQGGWPPRPAPPWGADRHRLHTKPVSSGSARQLWRPQGNRTCDTHVTSRESVRDAGHNHKRRLQVAWWFPPYLAGASGSPLKHHWGPNRKAWASTSSHQDQQEISTLRASMFTTAKWAT